MYINEFLKIFQSHNHRLITVFGWPEKSFTYEMGWWPKWTACFECIWKKKKNIFIWGRYSSKTRCQQADKEELINHKECKWLKTIYLTRGKRGEMQQAWEKIVIYKIVKTRKKVQNVKHLGNWQAVWEAEADDGLNIKKCI